MHNKSCFQYLKDCRPSDISDDSWYKMRNNYYYVTPKCELLINEKHSYHLLSEHGII